MQRRIRQVAGAILLLVAMSNTHSLAQAGIFLQVVRGSGNATAYTPEIPVTSAQYGLTNSSPIGSPSAGKASFSALILTKSLDASTAALQSTLLTGSNYQYVRLNYYTINATTGARTLTYRAVFGLALVTGYAAAADPSGCGDGCPQVAETITIQYGAFANFQPVGNLITTWNLITNAADVSTYIPASAITN